MDEKELSPFDEFICSLKKFSSPSSAPATDEEIEN